MSTQRFWKMSGSGNDFVFFDAREGAGDALSTPATIAALCDRRQGVGADGVVLIERSPDFAFSMRYFNRDGTLAEMCGNAALCSARLARELAIVGEGESFAFQTPSGPVRARIDGATPEIEMVPITELEDAYPTELRPGEARIGYARVGVPHLVVLCEDVRAVDVFGRGRQLRRLESLPSGANANFVSRGVGSTWLIRTYERGVEEETLACGTGAVATAALLSAWREVDEEVTLRTRSGRSLTVLLPRAAKRSSPILRGEGRIVFSGELRDLLETRSRD